MESYQQWLASVALVAAGAEHQQARPRALRERGLVALVALAQVAALAKLKLQESFK